MSHPARTFGLFLLCTLLCACASNPRDSVPPDCSALCDVEYWSYSASLAGRELTYRITPAEVRTEKDWIPAGHESPNLDVNRAAVIASAEVARVDSRPERWVIRSVEVRQLCACKWMYLVHFEPRHSDLGFPVDAEGNEESEGPVEYLDVPVFFSGRVAREEVAEDFARPSAAERSTTVVAPTRGAVRVESVAMTPDQSWSLTIRLADSERPVRAERADSSHADPTVEYRYHTRIPLDRWQLQPNSAVIREITSVFSQLENDADRVGVASAQVYAVSSAKDDPLEEVGIAFWNDGKGWHAGHTPIYLIRARTSPPPN